MTITREFYWCPWPLLRLGQDLSRLTFRVHTCSIPVVKTTYYDLCVNITDLLDPQLIGSGVQIIGASYIPSVEVNGVDNTPFVHHLAAFRIPGTCDPPGSRAQQSPVFYAWGPGTGPVVLLEKAGFPIAGDSYYFALAMNIHYDNCNGVPDRVDSTAIKVYYVKEK